MNRPIPPYDPTSDDPDPDAPVIDYEKCTIRNIHRGVGSRSEFIYAELVDENGELVISATLDYIVESLALRLP